MSNALSEEKRQQVIALGRLGWPLRRIEQETGVRRETASAYLKAAGIGVRPPRAWGRRPPAKPANEVITGFGVGLSDSTDGLLFIQEGKVQLSVVSEAGKEATLGILREGDLFGEGGLAGQLVRYVVCIALTECILLHVGKKAMMLAMSREPKLSAMFVKYLLKRNIRYQDDLVNQLFNSSEKRLARVLLLMAQFGTEGVSEMSVPSLSQETLAEMVRTTRSRVSFFMNRFRKLGFINYDLLSTMTLVTIYRYTVHS
jgi:CRP/FNR family cyclic AMP-dependent transcriptional regulator